MKIYIPTRGRTATQTTWRSIGEWARQRACLVCPESEVKYHLNYNRKVLSRGDVTGINNVREFIMDHAIENNHEKIVQKVTKSELSNFINVLIDDLEFKGFFHPSEKKDSMIDNIYSIYNKMDLTKKELNMLWGMHKKLKNLRKI